MYVMKAQIGGFICPSGNENTKANKIHLGQLHGYEGNVFVWTLSIPQNADNFSDFCKKMHENERQLIKLLD